MFRRINLATKAEVVIKTEFSFDVDSSDRRVIRDYTKPEGINEYDISIRFMMEKLALLNPNNFQSAFIIKTIFKAKNLVDFAKHYQILEETISKIEKIHSVSTTEELGTITRYEGEKKDGKYHGSGTVYFSNGEKYIGEFENGYIEGNGNYYYESGGKYVGEMSDNLRWGYGTCYYSHGNKYVGDWENDKEEGKGTMYYRNGDKYVGDWEEGLEHGTGIYYNQSGKIEYEGKWEKGEKLDSNTKEEIEEKIDENKKKQIRNEVLNKSLEELERETKENAIKRNTENN